MPRTQVADYYAAAHFILLPSRSEGWPKVLSEAMAYGVVPVAAAVSSIPQILGETRAGAALPVDDIEGLAVAIAGYVAEPERWAAAGRAGVVQLIASLMALISRPSPVYFPGRGVFICRSRRSMLASSRFRSPPNLIR